MESINTANIDVPVDIINLSVFHPFTQTLPVVADNGANIDAISGVQSIRYSRYIESESRAFRVRTGSGYVWCKDYLPLKVKNGDNKILKIKMYVIWNLPYDYLIGRNTIHCMNWKLSPMHKGTHVYHHARESLDSIDTKVPLCSTYPTERSHKEAQAEEPTAFNIGKRDPILKQFILNQLKQHKEIISQNEFDIGEIPCDPFSIEFKPNIDDTPIQCTEYPHSVLHISETERQLKYLYDIGRIRPSTSPWRFPTFIVPKKNGECRIVFDYRKLNAITKRMSYPLPSIQTLIDKFHGKEYITTIDMKSGYWHIPIKEEDRAKTAFVFNGKLWEWCYLPFGPTNAPPYFQKVMADIFADMDFVMVYLDDITIVSKDAEEHKTHIAAVFKLLNKMKIKIRADKCSFAQSSVEYLGFTIDKNGSRPTSKYKSKILSVPTPNTRKQLQRFVGMTNYLHKYVPNLQLELKPFYELLKATANRKFHWPESCASKFEEIKSIINNTDLLVHPDFTKPFEVYCDASINGIGCVLAQRHDGRLRVVQFCSKLFGKTQQNWHVSEQEIFSVIYAVEKWRSYLIGNKFTVFTDHKNLEELFNRAKNFKAGKLYRWAVRLQDFEFDAKYIKGSKNVFADYLSRDGLTNKLPSFDATNSKPKTQNILSCYLRHFASTAINHCNILYPDKSSFPQSLINDDTQSPEFLILSKEPTLCVHDERSHNAIERSHNQNSKKANDKAINSNKKPHYDYYKNYLDLQPSKATSESNQVQFIPKPSHKYNTRFQKNQQQDLQHQKDLNTKLTPIPDEVSFENPKFLKIQQEIARIRRLNDKIIKRKPSNPTYNKDLFVPTSLPINDDYDILQLSNDVIKHKQLHDPQLYAIIDYLKNNNKFLLSDLPDYLYRYVLSGRYYISNAGLLMYQYKDRKCIVIPDSLRYSATRWGHDNIHNGFDRIMSRITSRFWWPGMRDTIKSVVDTCHSCQSVKGGRSALNTAFKSSAIKSVSRKAPFEMISIDICGPLPMTKSGNRYIVSIIDKFSRFCLLVPVKNIKTTTIIKAYERWISLFGPPHSVLSDNGSQFVSEMFKKYNESLDIKQKFSSPYYPESNGQVERLHRWIKERLTLISVDLGTNFVDGDDDWDQYISLIQHSYNSTPNSMTSYSPNHIIFGQDLKITLDRINNIETTPTTPMEYVRMMENNRTIINNNVQARQAKYDESRVRTLNKNRTTLIKYEIGDYVMINVEREHIGNEKKFLPKWIGPFEVIDVNDKQYIVREIGNEGNVRRVNLRLIKPYKSSPYINIINRCLFTMNKSNAKANENILQYIRNKHQYHSK